MILYPEIDEKLPTYIGREDEFGYTMTHWREKDYFSYPFAAVSPAIGDYYTPAPRVRARLRVPPTFSLHYHGESDGFHDTVEEVVRWWNGNAQANDTVAAPSPSSPPFEERLAEMRGIAEVIRARKAGRYRVLLPVPKVSLPEMERWVEALPGFDGYSFETDNEPRAILRSLIYRDRFAPRATVFYPNLVGVRSLALTAYGENYLSEAMVGVRSHLGAVWMLAYLLPFDPRKMVRLFKGNELGSLPCDCSVCLLRSPKDFAGNRDLVAPLILHNLYQLIRYARMASAMRIYFRVYGQTLGPADGDLSASIRSLIEGFEYYRTKGYSAIRDRESILDDPEQSQQRVFDIVADPVQFCALDGEKEATDRRLVRGVEREVCKSCAQWLDEFGRMNARV